MRAWRGKGLRTLAAALLLGGAACGGGADGGTPGGDPGGLDGKGGDGGGAGGTLEGNGGTGGQEMPHLPPDGFPIDGPPGVGAGGSSGVLPPIGGGGGHGHGHGKGSECAEGKGLLHLRKEWCAPGADGGWADCEETPSEHAVHVTAKKIAPKVDVVWEGWISEAEEYRACVPVGTYRIWEDCQQLPAGASCFDRSPVELEVRERKATKHTFYNRIGVHAGTGLLEIRKAWCLDGSGAVAATAGGGYDCTAAHTDYAAAIEVRKAGAAEVVWSGHVTEDTPAALVLPPGAYEVHERCDVLPAAFSCLHEEPSYVEVTEGGEHEVELRNLLHLDEVLFEKTVSGCLEPTCGGTKFAVEYWPDGMTPAIEYHLDGAWQQNAGTVLVAPLAPVSVLLPRGTYVARERKVEGFEPRYPGGDQLAFEVPGGGAHFENAFAVQECRDEKDGDGDGKLDCAEPACLENDYLGCSRDACYFGAFIELRRVCNEGDAACLEADFAVRVEGRDTIWGETPSFAGTFPFPGGEEWLTIDAPCGTYEIEVLAPAGFEAVDPTFFIEVPSYYFPVKLHPPGGPIPPDPEDFL